MNKIGRTPLYFPSLRRSAPNTYQGKLFVVLVGILVYITLFPFLFTLLGELTGMFFSVHVFLISWFFGRRGGLVAGLVSLLLNSVLFAIAGAKDPEFQRFIVVGSAGYALMGIVVGHLSNVSEQLKIELIRREQAEKKLHQAYDDLERSISEHVSEATVNKALRKEIAQRQRAEAELQQRSQELAHSNRIITALSQIAARFETATDPDSVMETMGDELKALGIDSFVGLLDADDPAFILRYVSVDSRALRQVERLLKVSLTDFRLTPERYPPFRRIVEQKRAVFIDDARTLMTSVLPGFLKIATKRLLQLVNLQADVHAIVLPLMIDERVFGVLALWSPDLKASNVSETTIFASQVAFAFESARLLEVQRRQAGRLTALSQASTQLSANLKLQPTLEAILEHTLSQVPATDADIFLFDGEQLSFGASLIWGEGFQNKPNTEPRPHGLTNTVAHNGERIIVYDAMQDPLYRDSPWEGAIIGLPLRLGSRVWGVMNVAFDTARAFNNDDLQILQLLADQAASAIQNARLHAQEQENSQQLEQQVAARTAELQKTNEILAGVSERLRLATTSAEIGIWDWDIQRDKIIWDDIMSRLYGMEKSTFAGFSEIWSKRVHPDDKVHTVQEFERALQGGQEFDTEFRYLKPDGRTSHIAARAAVYRDESGQPVRMIGVSWDITESKQAERELRLAKEAAEAANRAKSAFLATMSHELRTPMNAILGYSQLMQRDKALTAEQRERLDVISNSGEHLLALINDVLEVSRIEAGRIGISARSFDLYHTLNTLETMINSRAQTKGLRFSVDCAPAVPQYIRTDEGKLRQVLMNLLDNAIKFTEQGYVELRVTTDDSENSDRPQACRLVFTVEDTGVGIGRDELETLFEPFTQTASGRRLQEGTGLGLSLSRQLVRLLGGEIAVNSRLGQGSIFTFDISVELTAEPNARPQKLPRHVIGLAPGQPGYRILVAEDRAESRTLLHEVLSGAGFDVKGATNGQEAVTLHQEWRPHLIWMDMHMPVMDGYQATRQIKALPQGQSTVIIAVTASAFEEDRADVLATGCDDFVRKPFREAEIFEKIAKHLDVQYLYEADNKVDEIETRVTIKENDVPLSLAGLPADWVADLHEATNKARGDQVLQLLKHIEVDYPALCGTLAQFVDEFRFDDILALVETGE